ncbi:unnamed protein product, partial [Prorocentrum cordatum]
KDGDGPPRCRRGAGRGGAANSRMSLRQKGWAQVGVPHVHPRERGERGGVRRLRAPAAAARRPGQPDVPRARRHPVLDRPRVPAAPLVGPRGGDLPQPERPQGQVRLLRLRLLPAVGRRGAPGLPAVRGGRGRGRPGPPRARRLPEHGEAGRGGAAVHGQRHGRAGLRGGPGGGLVGGDRGGPLSRAAPALGGDGAPGAASARRARGRPGGAAAAGRLRRAARGRRRGGLRGRRGRATAFRSAIARRAGVSDENVDVRLSVAPGSGRRLSSGQAQVQVAYTIAGHCLPAVQSPPHYCDQKTDLIRESLQQASAQDLVDEFVSQLRAISPLKAAAHRVEAVEPPAQPVVSVVPSLGAGAATSPTDSAQRTTAPTPTPPPDALGAGAATPHTQQHTSVGHGSPGPPSDSKPLYDCVGSRTNLPADWTPAQTAFCHGPTSSSPHVAASSEEPLAVTTTISLPATTMTITGSTELDCTSGSAKSEQGWSSKKKALCCRHAGVGCVVDSAGSSSSTVTTTIASSTISLPFDCNAGRARSERGWSVEKKAWCCKHTSYGCADHRSTTTTSERMSTNTSLTTVAMMADTTTDNAYASFDCDAGRSKVGTGLVGGEEGVVLQARELRLWCSVKRSRNSDSANSSSNDNGYSNDSIFLCTLRLRRRQSKVGTGLVGGEEGVVLQARELRLWCSVKRSRNSDSANSSSNDNGYSNDSIFLCTLRLRRRQSKVGTGLVGGEEGVVLQSQRLRVPRAPRNSNVHYHNNEAIREISTFRLRRWKGKVGTGVVGEKASVVLPARGRRLWRCHNFGDKRNGNSDIAYGNNISIHGNRVHVCEYPATTSKVSAAGLARYDCSAELWNWAQEWSPKKQAWCCRHEGRGCATTAAFDCAAGYSERARAWSESQRDWCCRHEGRGCAAAVDSPQYDCGETSDVLRWSAGQSAWCCLDQGVGCPGEAQLKGGAQPYDCDSGYSQFLEGLVHWSEGR